jgi:hypothetical protein
MIECLERLGCAVLGTDRVFRQYTYVESLSLIFVEGPLDNSYGLDEHCKDTQEVCLAFIYVLFINSLINLCDL